MRRIIMLTIGQIFPSLHSWCKDSRDMGGGDKEMPQNRARYWYLGT